jgi:hypothetical protein
MRLAFGVWWWAVTVVRSLLSFGFDFDFGIGIGIGIGFGFTGGAGCRLGL